MPENDRWIPLARAWEIAREHWQLSVDIARKSVKDAAAGGFIYTRGQGDRPGTDFVFLINPLCWQGKNMAVDFDGNRLIPWDLMKPRPAGINRGQLLLVGVPRIVDVRVYAESLLAWLERRDPPPVPGEEIPPPPQGYNKTLDPAMWGNPLPDIFKPLDPRIKVLRPGDPKYEALLRQNDEGSVVQKKRRHGPVPGTIDRYREPDRALYPEMERLIRDKHKTISEAAYELAYADKVAGKGTSESRAKRLAKRFRRERSKTETR